MLKVKLPIIYRTIVGVSKAKNNCLNMRKMCYFYLYEKHKIRIHACAAVFARLPI